MDRKIGFRQSRVDDCVFYQREVELIVFVGNGIFAALNDAEINQAIIEIGLKFDIEDQNTLSNYIGVNI